MFVSLYKKARDILSNKQKTGLLVIYGWIIASIIVVGSLNRSSIDFYVSFGENNDSAK